MDDSIGRQLVRQLRIINFWITFFGVIFVVALVLFGVVIYKTYTYAHHAEQQISAIQTQASSALNFQKQVCDNSELKLLLNRAGNYCQ